MSPKVQDVRPIGARALKSAIDTLRPYLSDAEVLDLYAGQGRFGNAAAKEGAKVTFVDLTSAALEKPQGEFVRGDVLKVLAKLKEKARRFDVVFADPPYPLWTPEYTKELFTKVSEVLSSKAIFLVKHPSRVIASLPIDGFSTWKTVPFGEATLIYSRYGEPK